MSKKCHHFVVTDLMGMISLIWLPGRHFGSSGNIWDMVGMDVSFRIHSICLGSR